MRILGDERGEERGGDSTERPKKRMKGINQ